MNPPKQYSILSVDAGSLSRRNTGSTTARPDKVALQVHRTLCRKCEFKCNDKWYDHQPLPVAESREVRITWDMTIFRDKRMKHNRPDITVVHKDKPLVDIAVLADQNILSKEEEKVEKYQDLALEIKRILLSPAVIIIIIIINEKIDYLQIQEYEY